MTVRETWLRDLCAEARAGRLDPVVGREALMQAVLRVLARRTKRNVILTGRPGVGKSALAEGVARQLAFSPCPPALRGAQVLALDLGSLLSGTSYRGEFEGRVSQLMKRLRSAGGPVILFIDEMHLLLRAGRSEGGLDAANLLKPALARGEVLCLGASTTEEWRRLAEEDPALARRFTEIGVPETDREQTLLVLRALRPGLEAHHGIHISDEALLAALEPGPGPCASPCLPDRAIDRLDEACAALQLACHDDPGAEAPRVAESRRRGASSRSFSLKARALELQAQSRLTGAACAETGSEEGVAPAPKEAGLPTPCNFGRILLARHFPASPNKESPALRGGGGLAAGQADDVQKCPEIGVLV